ncbi:MAG: glycosyltransferase [Nitrospiraceae bacterium]|nr:glycosyltransferase [Nitrospiraceae bacterium]
MTGILVFSLRDWLNPKADAAALYVHKVFAPVAAHGHYVALVCHKPTPRPFAKTTRPRLEIVDGIQIARLGHALFFKRMMGMFLSSLKTQQDLMGRLGVLVDCVTSTPLPLEKYVDLPIVPIVFDLAPKVQISPEPPGPLIAATPAARRKLIEAGVPDNFIVYAPAGVDCDLFEPSLDRSPTPSVIAVDEKPACLLKAVSFLISEGGPARIELIRNRRHWMRPSTVVCHDRPPRERRREFYQQAWLGYCGEGCEQYALEMAACGVPAVVPATETGKEYVVPDETGLCFTPGDPRELANCLSRLAKDEVLRKRLSRGAREYALQHSWQHTSNLVLGAIENLVPGQA